MTQGGLARSYGLLKDEDEGDEEDDDEMFFANQISPHPGFVCRFAEEFCLLHQVTARISVKRRRP